MDNLPITRRIDALLREKGISKQDFYRDCKITSAAFSQWNTGKTEPRSTSLQRIAEYLQTNYEYLITGLGPKEKENPPTVSSERKYPKEYDLLSETNKAIVDRLIADLAKHQSDN